MSTIVEEQPLISIIIPYGPGYNYDKVLESIRNVDYPKEKIEVMVIEGKLPARQRNVGIKQAKGKILFFFDDDVILEKDIINHMLSFYDDEQVAIVGGPNLTPPSDSFIQKCFGHVMENFFGTAQMSNRYKRTGKPRKATEKDLILCNLSGRASVLKENLLNETLYPAEENELFNRLQRKGYTLMYDPAAICYHSRRPSVKKFITQNFGYGRGRGELFVIQPECFDPIFLIPLTFSLYFISAILFLLLNVLPFKWRLIYSLPAALYILVDIAVSLFIAIKDRCFKTAVTLPLLFPLAHFPYSAGMVQGIVKRLVKQKTIDRTVTLKEIKL